MDTGKRQHLQDIYASDTTKRDDYTPQVSNEVLAERKREELRNRFSTFALGATVLALLVGLVFVIVKKYMSILKDAAPQAPIAREYIPRYSLPTEDQWIMDLQHGYADPTWNGDGERPFNSVWLKKAAYNIIMAEQAMELGKSDKTAYKEAAKYYEQALEIVPDLEGVKVPLGNVYFELGEYAQALKTLEEAPDDDLTAPVLNNLGAACSQAKAYDKSESYLKRALELDPTYADALKNLAQVYKKTDRPDEATRIYERFLDQRPSDTATRYDFALYLTKVGNWEIAAEQFRELTKQVTDDHMMYFLLARAENKLGNKEAATDALRRGIQLTDPKLAIAWMDETEFDQLRNTEEFQSLMKYIQ
jgi:tetratricopeptide (TPR) repeat protein